MIRVFIIAASPVARAGLETLLAARGMEVVGGAATIEAASEGFSGALSEAVPDDIPEVVLVDAEGKSASSFVDSIISSGLPSEAAVVILADSMSPAISTQALRGGIRSVLPRDISPDQLAASLQAVAAGLVVLHSAALADGFLVRPVPARSVDELVEPLTPREREVLQMLAGGLANKEIAAKLGISEHTVKFHVTAILGKFGATSRTEAVSLGIRQGLVLL